MAAMSNLPSSPAAMGERVNSENSIFFGKAALINVNVFILSLRVYVKHIFGDYSKESIVVEIHIG